MFNGQYICIYNTLRDALICVSLFRVRNIPPFLQPGLLFPRGKNVQDFWDSDHAACSAFWNTRTRRGGPSHVPSKQEQNF